MFPLQPSSNATRNWDTSARSAWSDWRRSYLEGLQEAAARRRPDQTLLVLFLGSSIGNFDPPAAENFLRDIRRHLKPGDALLLGTDVEKSVHDMLLAYDDPTGVTAAFNLNLLARINRELGGDFILRHFEHHVRYQEMDRRIEMHLRSTQEPNRLDSGRGL